MPILREWLARERRVAFAHRASDDVFAIAVARPDGRVITREVTALELAQSRVPAIELVQRLFEDRLDRMAVGLAARRWYEDGAARRIVAAGADFSRERERARRPRIELVEDRSGGLPENRPYASQSPRSKATSLGPPNPRLPIYRPR